MNAQEFNAQERVAAKALRVVTAAKAVVADAELVDDPGGGYVVPPSTLRLLTEALEGKA